MILSNKLAQKLASIEQAVMDTSIEGTQEEAAPLMAAINVPAPGETTPFMAAASVSAPKETAPFMAAVSVSAPEETAPFMAAVSVSARGDKEAILQHAAVNRQLPQQTTAADKPQQGTRQQQQQQNYVREAADMRQQQQQWKPGRQQQAKAQQQQIGQEAARHLSLADARLLSFLDEAEEASKTMRHFWKDHNVDYLDMIWTSLQAAEAKYKTKNARYIRTIMQQQHGCDTTLEANCPRGGDDWAD